MTPSSQTFSGGVPVLSPRRATASGPVDRAREAIAGLACQLRGHSPQLRLDGKHIRLFCPDCRRVSPGWHLDGTRPRLRQAGDPDRFQRYAWLTGTPEAVAPGRREVEQ